ncbi:MAG: gluconate 2-dehydrogenase subunit 3 family protein, partial [Longimicrobiales bacterium]
SKRDSPSWNEQTRNVIDHRLRDVPLRHFFLADEWELLEAVCARLLPQPDRGTDAIPIVPWIDDRIHRGTGENFRRVGTLPEPQRWRVGLAALQHESLLRHDLSFTRLTPADQDSVLRHVQKADVVSQLWQAVAAQDFFNELLTSAVDVYYAHPAAWSEIGFGGPASPRGYVRLAIGHADPWEAKAVAHD